MRVTGEATVTTKLNQAQIGIGVVTQAETAEAAAAQNAQKLDVVLAELRKAVGPEGEIQTVGYSLRPNYRYPKEGGQPAITGYTASNIVRVKTNKLDEVGSIIDLVARLGANTIQRLVFTRKDEEVVRTQALQEAATEATRRH
jgi:hypothetical protein